MNVQFDSLNRFETPKIYLCNPGCYLSHDGTIGGVIGIIPNTTDEEILFNFNAVSEMNFRVFLSKSEDKDINEYQRNIYKSIQTRRNIYVDDIGFFSIVDMSEGYTPESGDYKDVSAQSIEIEMQNTMLTYVEDNTYKFDDLLNKIMSNIPAWNIGTIDETIKNKYRTFEGVSTDLNTLAFMQKNMQDAYECIFEYDTMHRLVNVYDQSSYFKETSIFITKEDVIKNIDISDNSENIYTALRVIGANNLNISPVNPIGTNVIYNFDHYLLWMSDKLGIKVKKWQLEIESSRKEYYDLNKEYYNRLTEKTSIEKDIEKCDIQLTMYQRCRDNIVAENSKSGVGAYNEVIEGSGGTPIDISGEINDVLASIDSLMAKVNDDKALLVSKLELVNAAVNVLLNKISLITNKFDINNYFTAEEYKELFNYIYEGVYNDEYIIVTDAMTYDEKFQKMNELYDKSVVQLGIASTPSQEFSIGVESFIFNKDFASFTKQIESGCTINVQIDSKDTAILFLSGISVNYHDYNMSLTFGRRLAKYDTKSLFEDALGNIKKSANTLDYIKDIIAPVKAGEIDALKEALANSRNLTMDAALASANQEVLIDGSGYTGKKMLDNGEYDPRQVKIVNNSMVFTDDAWDTCKVALGEIILGDGKSTYGLNAKTIIGEMIIGGELHILDKEGKDIFSVMDGNISIAIDKANEANKTANDANSTANSANTTATNASNAANEAKKNVTELSVTVDGIKSDVTEIQTDNGNIIKRLTSVEQTASGLEVSVSEANTTANEANKTANTANDTANTANNTANSASATAASADKKATDLTITVDGIKNNVEQIQQDNDKIVERVSTVEQTASGLEFSVSEANKTAGAASDKADAANNKADTASNKAEEASNKADAASNTANDANSTANSANENATNANNTANSANETANTANENATNANNTANAANETANAANSTAEAANKTANAASEKATELELTVDGLKTVVTNTSVGGDNILTDTEDMKAAFSVDSAGFSKMGTIVYNSDGSATVTNNNSNTRFIKTGTPIVPGRKYTISVMYRLHSGAENFFFQLSGRDEGGNQYDFIQSNSDTLRVEDQGFGWVRYSLTFSMPSTGSKFLAVFLSGGKDYQGHTNKFDICHAVLNEGTLPSAWSPSSKDLKALVEVTAEGITSQVSRVDEKADTAINNASIAQQTADEVSATVSTKLDAEAGTWATFGWELRSNSWTIKANNETIFQVLNTGAYVKGEIVADSGTIGGWGISDWGLRSGGGDTGRKLVAIQAASPSSVWTFISGADDEGSFATAPFRVNSDGSLYATSAHITGEVFAESGTIGGFTLKDGYLSTNGATWADSSKGIYIGPSGIAIGNGTEESFVLYSNGDLIAKNADISGTITADSGTIGGWSLEYWGLHSNGASSMTAIQDASLGGWTFVAGAKDENSFASAPFRVHSNGTLYATSAHITGAITATSGSFTGNVYSSGGTIGPWRFNGIFFEAGSGTFGSPLIQLSSVGVRVVDNTGEYPASWKQIARMANPTREAIEQISEATPMVIPEIQGDDNDGQA